ncbi:helicase RepA family protein [Kistimonas scapharcae]|uniref:Helicase RepA family protein n=1 Tax=Kistimonas scapharcae TaxID=1036133 RepID=A0ABP8V5X6_9GAMM
MTHEKQIENPLAYARKILDGDSEDFPEQTTPKASSSAAISQSYDTHTITFQKVGDLIKNIEIPEWLVEDYIEANTLLLMFAPPSSYKSFLAVDLAACIATGKQWHGHDVRQGAVFYIVGEGLSGLKRRFRAWTITYDVDMSECPLLMSDGAVDLMSPTAMESLSEQIEQMVDEAKATPVLIIFDTLARNSTGNENNNSEMGLLVRQVDQLIKRFNCSALLVHHTGHSDGLRARGASSLKGAVDAEYHIRRDGDSNLVTISNTKMKDSESPAAKTLELRSVELGIHDAKGRPVTSGVLVDTDRQPSPERNNPKLGKKEEVMWQAIRCRMKQGESTEAAVIRDDLKAQGFDVRNFSRVRTNLLNKGMIEDDNGRLIPINLSD